MFWLLIPLTNPSYPTTGVYLELIYLISFSLILPVLSIYSRTLISASSMRGGGGGGVTREAAIQSLFQLCFLPVLRGGLKTGLCPMYPTTGMRSIGLRSLMLLGTFLQLNQQQDTNEDGSFNDCYSYCYWAFQLTIVSVFCNCASIFSAVVANWVLRISGFPNSDLQEVVYFYSIGASMPIVAFLLRHSAVTLAKFLPKTFSEWREWTWPMQPGMCWRWSSWVGPPIQVSPSWMCPNSGTVWVVFMMFVCPNCDYSCIIFIDKLCKSLVTNIFPRQKEGEQLFKVIKYKEQQIYKILKGQQYMKRLQRKSLQT